MINHNESNRCRFCSEALSQTLIDLGDQPYANNYLPDQDFKANLYPLHVKICSDCKLVQHMTIVDSKEIFDDYGYFSSYSDHWLKHCQTHANNISERINLNKNSTVVEIASNDGYMLKFFKEKGINVLGIDPAENVAKIAIESGIETIVDYFGQDLANDIIRNNDPDLVIANNVLAHVPDINDFVSGLEVLLRSGGISTIEFPHYLNLINQLQFDTIYHEHFSYLSLTALDNIFSHHNLKVFDADVISTHGGSLRAFICHIDNDQYERHPIIDQIIHEESTAEIFETKRVDQFQIEISNIRRKFIKFIEMKKREGKKIACFGAAAKGNTFLNYVNATYNDIAFVVDDTPYKQNKYLPGSNIPIVSKEELIKQKPDYVIVLPWNHKKEIIENNKYIFDWGASFIVAIPEIEIIDHL